MLKRNASQLVNEANNAVETIPVEKGIALVGDDCVVIVDVRETVERQQSGAIKGSVHAARGFLEFHADPDHPKYNPAIRQDKRLVLYCATGGRSALAAKTLVDMGYSNVCHIAGGFGAWTTAGGPTE